MPPPDRTVPISPRTIIEQLLRNMQESIIEMFSYNIVPSVYRVFLNSHDFHILEPILGRVVADAQVALDRELVRLNRTTAVQRLTFRRSVKHERADKTWRVELLSDPDDDTLIGLCTIRSELAVPQPARAVAAGTPTRFTTTFSDSAVVKRELVPAPAEVESANRRPDAGMSGGRPLAELRYQDATGQQRVLHVTKSEVLVFVGSNPTAGDVAIIAPGCSEVAISIRRDSRTGMFSLRNVSVPVLTVNGRPVPAAVEIVLPSKASFHFGDYARCDFAAIG